MNAICRLLGHKWVAAPELRYEQGTAMAWLGNGRKQQRVSVTWCCDEVCERCGAETWWPS